MKKSSCLIRTGLFFVFAVAVTTEVSAQEFWARKSYKTWTKEEIIKIISDSPWAQVRETEADITTGGTRANVTIRLRSALPIRQALVRLKQLEAKYDKMDQRQQAEFDERLRGTLECPACKDNYVVTMSPPISNRNLTSGVYGLKGARLELLHGKVYLLNEQGDRRPLVYFVAPKNDMDEAVFYFPRRDDQGNELLTEKNKSLSFVFDAEISIMGTETTTERRIVVTDSGAQSPGSAGSGAAGQSTDTLGGSRKGRTVPRQVTFDVSKLLVNGKVEF